MLALAPSGDQAAIAFYRQKAAAYEHVPGATIVETGYFFVRPSPNGTVDYWWGTPPPAGYAPARVTIHARLGGGRIVAYLADLRAPHVKRLRIVMSGGAVFTRTGGCWARSKPTASPLGTGDRYVFNDGGASFAPRSGTSVTFSYEWAPGDRATETSTFGSGATRRVDVAIRVTGRHRMLIRKSIVALRTAPALPVPSPPALPVPKPLCASH